MSHADTGTLSVHYFPIYSVPKRPKAVISTKMTAKLFLGIIIDMSEKP